MRKQTLILPGPWEFREFPETARRMSDLEEGHWLKTDQPQSIFLSLAQAKILTLDDIYAQPRSFKWVGRQAWVFRTRFIPPDEHLSADRKELVFEGLDTVTQIWLNDKLLGRTGNMFMSHRFDIGALLVQGENTLVIQFLPAQEHADKLMQRYGKTGDTAEQSSSRYLRKAQYHFGSVLGPDMINCGIIRPVRLELTRVADIADIHLRTIDCNESVADIRAAITLRQTDSNRNKDLRCVLRIRGEGPVLSHTLDFKNNQNRLAAVLRIERPILWQPRGYGIQFRYHILAQLYCQDNLLDEKELFFGIRTVRHVRPQDEAAISPALEVNQQSIQTHGVYWIPTGLLPGPDEMENKKRLLHKLADANINLLCVWGGGSYQEDGFYDLCDELGILVWQELMFTPAHLPDRLWIINEFRREMEQVICQLRNHACLVGWCSGRTDGHSTKDPHKRKKHEHGDLLDKEITELLNEGDPDRDCITAFSVGQTKEGQLGRFHPDDWLNTPHNPPVSGENPLCALPGIETLRMTCRNEEIFPGSAQLESQIYCPAAYSSLRCQTEALFAPPGTIEDLIYQSQAAQGRWAKKRIESLRAENTPRQLTMPWTAGQFWPCAGFSMLDFAQKPNALYYYAKRGFAPVLVCLTEQQATAQISPSSFSPSAMIINDRPDPLMGRIVFELLDMKGQVLDAGEFPVVIGPYSRNANILLPRAFLNPTFPQKNLLRLAVWDHQQQVCENIYLFVPDKYVLFKPMEIDLSICPLNEQTIRLELKSRYFVKDLQLVPPQNAELENNFFDLLPGRNYEMTVTFSEPLIRPDAPWTLRSVCTL
jgi:beta-mannosidase